MAVRRPALHQRARVLREQGWTLRRIANEVGVALSTVSLWVRDVHVAVEVVQPLPTAPAGPGGEVQIELGSRRCGRCLRDLPLENFNRHPTGRQGWCRDCFREYFRARAQLHRDQVAASRPIRRRKGRAFVSEYLRNQRCSDCGEADPLVLEFHHLTEKRGNVADMVNAGFSVRALERELGKCIVVCVNCHRLKTAASGTSWRLDPESFDRSPHLTPGERRNVTYVRELLMQSRCVDCGDSRLVVLDFDHVGLKTANVTELARRGCSLRRLEAEVSQCEIRCANCHRRRTLGLQGEMTA